jgi:hypothetical protein
MTVQSRFISYLERLVFRNARLRSFDIPHRLRCSAASPLELRAIQATAFFWFRSVPRSYVLARRQQVRFMALS